MDLFKNLSDGYEIINPKEEIFKQKDFFKKIIKDYSIKSCLDCACGTGWHLYMLNKLGVKCYGSDISPAMRKKARKNLKDTGIKLKIEDFRNLLNSWDIKFDMIICMSTSFPHMLKDKDAIKSLNSIYSRLNNKGILIIANGLSDRLLDTKPKFIPASISKDHAFYVFPEYPNSKRIIYNILILKRTRNGFDHCFDSIEYNAIRKSTFEKYLSHTKFKSAQYFGDFDFSKYSTKKSNRIIVITQK
jgi:glycine/sarcosine N-methyltransferase